MTDIILIEQIEVSPKRQRQTFPEAEMAELKESISSSKGLLCPILVRPKGEGRYVLVAGERRLRAIKSIEGEYVFGDRTVPSGSIPAVVKHFPNDMEALEAELHENIVRLNLTWQERARAIADLHALQQARNPSHSIGQTAYLIDPSETAQKTGYAQHGAYKRVEAALLVRDYLETKEVREAASLKDATKVVTRILENEMLMKLQQRRLAIAAEVATQHEVETIQVTREEDPLAFLSAQRSECVLYEGDMREELLKIVDSSVNVVITDPPYGQGVDEFGDSGSSALAHDYSEDNFEELHEVLCQQIPRICAPSAHVYIFCHLDYFHRLRDLIAVHDGWRVRRTPLIWSKGQTGNLADGTAQGYKRSYECILYASRGKRPCAELIADVLYYPMVKQKVHAAQKPVQLYEKLLRMSAIPGDVVLDAFAGSGTLFHAARVQNIKAIGIENNSLSIEMCQLAMEGKMPDWQAEL